MFITSPLLFGYNNKVVYNTFKNIHMLEGVDYDSGGAVLEEDGYCVDTDTHHSLQYARVT